MSCRRSEEIDLPGFVAAAAGAGDADFREHYPSCPDCAAEVRAFTELHLALAAPAERDAGHPAPETLARLEAGSLPPVERDMLERHLAGCPTCRDEVASLRGLELPAVPMRPAVGTSAGPGPIARLAERARGLVLHPAFAYTVALLLVYPAVTGRLGGPAVPDLPAAPAGQKSTDDANAALRPLRAPSAAETEIRAKARGDATQERAARLPRPALAREVFESELVAKSDAPVKLQARKRALVAQEQAGESARDAVGGVLDGKVEALAPSEPRLEYSRLADADTDAAVDEVDALFSSAGSLDGQAPESGLAGAYRGSSRLNRLGAARAAPKAVPPVRLDGHRLYVRVPPELEDFEVRVRDADGQRTLAQRFAGAASGEVSLELPPSWTEGGRLHVEVAPRDSPEPLLRLVIEVP